MDKSNIAFAVLTVILGVYISTALWLSRTKRQRGADQQQAISIARKRNRPWTSFSS